MDSAHRAMVGRDESPFPSVADHPRVGESNCEKKHLVDDENADIRSIREARRSRLSFNAAAYASPKLPVTPLNSSGHPSRPSTAGRKNPFRVKAVPKRTSLVSLISYNAEVGASRKDEFFDGRQSTSVRLPEIAHMFMETYRMPIASAKNPPYKHLQPSSSVDSNGTPPSEHARGGSPPPPLVSPDKANSADTGSNSTMITTVTDTSRQRSGFQHSNRVHPIQRGQLSHDNHQSSNDDDDLTYHPNSPRSNKKPMIFERRPSRPDSANLLRVPDSFATAVGALNAGPFTTEAFDSPTVGNSLPQDGGKLKDGKTPDLEKGIDRVNGPSSITGHNNALQVRGREKSEKAAAKAGVFMSDHCRQVDFILVYERHQSTSCERQRLYFETNLQQEGLVLESDCAPNDDASSKLCFVRAHAPWNTLCRSAEMLHMKMPLRNTELPQQESTVSVNSASLLETITDYFCSNWFDFNDTEKILIGGGSKHVTAQFTRARLEKFLITDRDTFFTPTQRIRIVYEIMQKAKCDPDNGKKRGVQWLLKSGVYTAAYPIHDGETETGHLSTNEPEKWSQRQILKYTWASFNRLFARQPLNLIRAYFGEKIGFYFAWLGFYTQMLIFPSVVGVICFLMGVFSLSSNPLVLEMCDDDHMDARLINVTMCPVCRLPNCRPWALHKGCESARWNYRFDNESHVIMAVFTLLWGTIFMELWKRKEAELAAEWDAFDAEQGDEPTRPEYEARTKLVRISPVTSEEEPHVSRYRRALWLTASSTGVFLLILCVVLALIALIVVRIAIYGLLAEGGGLWEDYKFEIASLIIHVFTFVVVMTLGTIYEPTAHRLTELECPRTQADYLSSYIWKVFIFEILNNFIPILYAALVRGRCSLPHTQDWLTEMCDPGGCMNEVVQGMAILLLARLLISNAAEVGVPFLRSLLKSKGLGKITVHPDSDDNATRKLPRWQRDFALNEPALDGVYAEYLEMMVQFGYVTLFIAAFPLAPLICLLNNIVEIRIDATNFVASFRRPLPARVSGIRIWRRCLNIILKLSVLCNGAFLAFTSEFIPTLVYRYSESDDYSAKGYMWWTMAKMNTSDWTEYLEFDPGTNFCYYRDFRGDNSERKLIWWQIMVARLAFFVVFVITFYFIQWLGDFLVPDVPTHVRVKVERANFLARQTLYGQETSGPNSAGSGSGPRQTNHSDFLHSPTTGARRATEETTAPFSDFSDPQQKHPFGNGCLNPASNFESPKTKTAMSFSNGVVMSGNGHVATEATEDDDAFEQPRGSKPQWDKVESSNLHPNRLPSPLSPLYPTSPTRGVPAGATDHARFRRDQTQTSNV